MSLLKQGWQEGYVHTNGINLHYVTQGEGRLMLMLHGFPEFWYSWRHQIPEFAQDYKVVAIDLRGYNDSDKPKDVEAYKMSELTKDIEGVIEGLGYQSCILVGHDWGGAIAWSFAYAHPEMVDKLIVLNLPHPAKFAQGLHSPQQLLKSWYMFFFQLPLLPELIIQSNDYELISFAFTNMAVDKSAFSQEDLEAYKDAAAKRGALTAMLNYYRNIFDNSFLTNNQQQWKMLDLPTLMIWGENDTALGKELTYGTEEYVSNFQIKYIPNCSHWVQQERPELVNQYMREFLS
ncbi:Soluble epoxide hydrolase [Stanieria cyanosphaera PCC 7437]|uniref:Soluble epoxide hydrolase n=1 Tax=Stanieria cyanosphaera (strain ATCC 29371 / PCC 7437) TaxID=111780 RepID=K9XWS0_STAC7|nr:alpha/beta hydrolase [Stanieria cyanosphaera]AFZ36983.1 Soluble epoxide hydrolase [Stanieria cyanosphaera PCC 7437]